MIPDDQVEEVRARADIVDVVGEFVDLQKSGKDFKASCPFHEERTPSFYVVPDKGFYNCFGCGESGDVFSFVMKRAGLGFVDAVKHVAGRAGVEIREVTRSSPEEEDPDRPLYELNAFARDFYRRRLADPGIGRIPRDYLESRGVDEETAERFGLGYAPDDWQALRQEAAHHGYDDELMLEAGLLSTSERNREPYDRFRDRIVFPIEDVSGRVVAFGGRVLGKDAKGPKYLNSPETPVYHKGEILYGLSWGRHAIRRESSALVVEGYMDLVALAAAGFENVVATLGTSVTMEHARLLDRYTERVHLLFDSDTAGLRATFRAADILLASGLHPAVVTLPPGEDPDTLVREEGAAGLRHYLDQAVDVVDRKLQLLDEKGYFRDIERTRQALDRLLPTLRATADPALRDIYVTKVSERTGVQRATLEDELERSRRGATGREATGGSTARAGRRAPRSGRGTPGRRVPRTPRMGPERDLLRLLLRDRDWVEVAGERIGPEDFADASYAAIFQALLDDPGLKGGTEGLDPVAAKRLEELLADAGEMAAASDVFESAVGRLRMAAIQRRSEALERRIRESDDPEEREALTMEKVGLSAERRAIGLDWSHTARKLRAESTRDSREER